METFIGSLLLIPGFVVGLAFHEFAHALAADRLGDPTPRQQGRLTIDPIPHIDIVGFIALFLVHFGWAKPVMIDPRNFKNPKRDDIIVSLAGPAANLVMAILFAIIIATLNIIGIEKYLTSLAWEYLSAILEFTIYINLLLMVFNLLPIPPLDGSHVVANLLPDNIREKYMGLQVYSLIVFIILAFTGIFGKIILPVVLFIYALIKMIFGI